MLLQGAEDLVLPRSEIQFEHMHAGYGYNFFLSFHSQYHVWYTLPPLHLERQSWGKHLALCLLPEGVLFVLVSLCPLHNGSDELSDDAGA